MDYAEATYFEGYHFHHISAWWEAKRLALRVKQAKQAVDRRSRKR